MDMEQPESRTSQATILQAVITGFDELSQSLEPARINELVNNCYEISNTVISLYGGTMDHFTGWDVMALFGIPDHIEKAPFKAVGAAIDLVNKITEMNRETDLPVPIGIKVGINTGPVMIEKILKDRHTKDLAMGETVSMVSRICDVAENGQILIGQATFESVKDRFEFVVMEPVPVKGAKQPLPLFEVTGRKRAASAAGIGSSRIISSAMVGRAEELNGLEKQFMQLINGRGAVVSITGIAGIGKSRLMAEMREKELMSKVIMLEGRALSNGKDLSFHPIIQIIKSWAGIKEEDTSDDALNKLQRGIHRVYSEAVDEIFPFIATMMGYHLEGKARERVRGIEGEALENLILKNLRDLLARAATVRPVVIVIEDAHWCDISSVIFLESLFKLVRKQRILFVTVFRPGYPETGEQIRKFVSENLKDHYHEIIIDPLAQKESEELIDNLLHQVNLPEEINQLIIDRAAGNPFFIEEVIRSFLDEGLIEVKNDRFLLTENIKYANIPESIDNVLLSRIDRLDEQTKELLKTASVIGRNFYYKVLEEAAVTIEEVDNKLEYLKDVQLINERKKRDEVEFLFKHALAQQATYESIVEKTKKELHLKIANSIEKVFAGRIHEFYGMLAHHYSKAGKQDKTEEYLIKASDESMKSGASSEAASFLKQALEIYLQLNKIPDPQKVVDLQEKLGFAYYSTGQHQEAVECFDKLIAFYYKPLPTSTVRRLADLAFNLMLTNWKLYFYKVKPEARTHPIDFKIMKINNWKAQCLTSIDPKRVFFESFYSIRFMRKKQFGTFEANLILAESSALFFTGMLFKLGQKFAEWGKEFLDEKHVLGWLWGKYTHMMYIYYSGLKTGIEDEEKVYRLGIQTGEYWPVSIFFLYCGFNTIEWGYEKQTLHYLKLLTDLSDAFDNTFTFAQYHRLTITYNTKFRKIDEIFKAAEEANTFIMKSNNLIVLFMIYSCRAMAFTFQLKLSEARTNLIEAEKLVKILKIPVVVTQYLISISYIEIAEIASSKNHIQKRKRLIKATKQLIKQSQKARANLTEAYRLHAIACCFLNKPVAAVKNFKRSIQAGTSYGAKLELSRTYFEIGKFLRDPKSKRERINGMNGTEFLVKAKAMFKEMNLNWDLAEYEKYIGNHATH
jgi:class 3 adenylate cyclase/tetratricopeptide (TPR) repeat protein